MDQIPKDTSIVILVGGYSRRFGNAIKALQPIKGKPMLELVIEKFSKYHDSIVLSVANPEIKHALGNVHYRIEVDKNEVPVHSLIDLLSTLSSRYAIVLAVDMPMVAVQHCRNLVQQLDNFDLAVNSVSNSWITSTFFAINLQNWDWGVIKAKLRSRNRYTDLIRYAESICLLEYAEPHNFANINSDAELKTLDLDQQIYTSFNAHKVYPKMYLKEEDLPLVDAFRQEIRNWPIGIKPIYNHIKKDIKECRNISPKDKAKLLSLLG